MSTMTHGTHRPRPLPSGAWIRAAAGAVALVGDALATVLITNHRLPVAVASVSLALLAWFASQRLTVRQSRPRRPSASTRG
ncbi:MULTISPECIES: hypothetical protein [Streptacidiphilus]|uniref:Uncharacterized protein n=2 Tax=Streptacidiphilus TaxID=228398 RepID=A0ABV6UJ30_9ACTN|nr:hypothetical protein [Streptacidiphilus jeojiense]